jgi:hypothetical protein
MRFARFPLIVSFGWFTDALLYVYCAFIAQFCIPT